MLVVEQGSEPGFFLQVILQVLLGEVGGEYVLGIEQFGIDVLEMFALDVNDFGVVPAVLEGKVDVVVVLVDDQRFDDNEYLMHIRSH